MDQKQLASELVETLEQLVFNSTKCKFDLNLHQDRISDQNWDQHYPLAEWL